MGAESDFGKAIGHRRSRDPYGRHEKKIRNRVKQTIEISGYVLHIDDINTFCFIRFALK